MRSIIQAIAAAGAVFFCVGAAEPPRVDYTLTPVMEDGALRAVQVDLRFRGDADGRSSVRLPDSWGGQDELWRAIQNLEIVSGASAIRQGEQPNQRILNHSPNARIHLRYRVIQDWDGVPRAEIGNVYRPTIQPTYFHLIGNAFMVTPDSAPASMRVRFRVRDLPRGWSYASDLEHSDLRMREVWSSIAVAGDFRILRDPASKVRLAIRGEWGFTDEQLLSQISGIVATHRQFWDDRATPYLVTALQLAGAEGQYSVGGTALDDAFAFFSTPNGQQNSIVRMLAHESFHTWMPNQVGNLPQQDQALQYWLSEGFTDFYTARMLVRGGVWTPQQYADDLNEALRAYAQSPARAYTNAQVLTDFWNSRDVQRIPYQRGRLLAMIWDSRLRENGHGFDDLVNEMRRRARRGARYAVETFNTSAAAAGLDPRSEIAANIDAGEFIFLPADLLAPCGRIVTRQVPNFHRGFDIEATQANNDIVAGVDPALPAYAAGVRNGMVLVRRDGGEIGDSEKEIVYVMRDGGTERTFRYMPRGHGEYPVQRLELAQDLAGERLAQCVAAIAG